MKKIIFVSVVYLFCISPISVFAEVTIITAELPGLHEIDRTGSYDKIIQETLINAHLATLEMYPPARARAMFNKCQNCCISPLYKNPELYELSENVVQTDPMNYAKVYIFVNHGKMPVHRLEGLRDKKVGVQRGSYMGKNFKKAQFETSAVNKLEQIIKMLQLGHLDAIVASVPEVYAAFRRLGIKPFPHDVSHPIAVHQDRLLCRGVKIAFIDKFNKLLKQLRNRGRLKNILGDNYIAE